MQMRFNKAKPYRIFKPWWGNPSRFFYISNPKTVFIHFADKLMDNQPLSDEKGKKLYNSGLLPFIFAGIMLLAAGIWYMVKGQVNQALLLLAVLNAAIGVARRMQQDKPPTT